MKQMTLDYVDRELFKLKKMKVGAMTHPRTPLCIVLDFSGSMNPYRDQIVSILRNLTKELNGVDKRFFTLIIIGIFNGRPRIWYFGDLKELDVEDLIFELPDQCRGTTPLVESFQLADHYLTEVSKACESSTQICTIPFYIIITDAKSTETRENYTGILKTLAEDTANNRKIVVECYTRENEDGLDFGGYKIVMDHEGSEAEIENCMKALRLASSSNVDQTKGVFEQKSRPPKSNRSAYCDYMSTILAGNMLFYFSNLNSR